MFDLLDGLISADSTFEKGECETTIVLKDFFESAGIDCEIDNWDGKRANITAVVEGSKKQNAKKLLVASHLDVVPAGQQAWKYPPFKMHEEGDYLYGRGVVDMKGGLAASAVALAEIVKNGTPLENDIIFTATACEEVNSEGALRFVDKNEHLNGKIGGIIVPEPTNMIPSIAHKGILWFKVVFKGKTAHGSMPHAGVNAFEHALEFVAEVKKSNLTAHTHDLLGNCTLSFNKIEAGAAINVIPDLCSLWGDFRLLPSMDYESVMSQLNIIISNCKKRIADFDAEVIFERYMPALSVSPDCGFVKAVCDLLQTEIGVLNYTTDSPYFCEFDAPCVVLGPGDPQMCHKPDERILKTDLTSAKDKYVQLYKKLS